MVKITVEVGEKYRYHFHYDLLHSVWIHVGDHYKNWDDYLKNDPRAIVILGNLQSFRDELRSAKFDFFHFTTEAYYDYVKYMLENDQTRDYKVIEDISE
jgi:hypothetical protein